MTETITKNGQALIVDCGVDDFLIEINRELHPLVLNKIFYIQYYYYYYMGCRGVENWENVDNCKRKAPVTFSCVWA
jgi:hypothetical protein